MAAETDLDVFARVIDGQIVEYPVFRLHIVNRGHPLDWYTPVVESPKPTLPPYSNYKPSLSVIGGTVVVTYSVVPQSLGEILQGLAVPGENTNPLPGQPADKVAPLITEISPDTVTKVYDLVGEYVMAKLDTWANTRKYTTFNTLLGYRDSGIAKFKAEALRGNDLRDQIWAALTTYFDKVTTGQEPVPISTTPIDALVPPLLWPDETAPGEQPEVPLNPAPVAPPPETAPAVHVPAILFPVDDSSVGTSFTGVTTAFVSDDPNDSFSQLTWEASPDPTFATNVLSGVSTTDQTFEVTGLVEGGGYALRVAHTGALLGQSPWSTSVRITVPNPNPPPVDPLTPPAG